MGRLSAAAPASLPILQSEDRPSRDAQNAEAIWQEHPLKRSGALSISSRKRSGRCLLAPWRAKREALNAVTRSATIITRPFEHVPTLDVSFVTCRALDQFIEKIPDIIRWAPPRSSLLLFGGETLREKLSSETQEYKIPLSERRFLFVTAANRVHRD